MDWYVVLDDATRAAQTVLTDLRRVDEVTIPEVDDALAAGWADGLHCFAWLPYDLGEAHLGIRGPAVGALYWFAEHTEGRRPLPDDPAFLAVAHPTVEQAAFTDRIALLQEAIAAGRRLEGFKIFCATTVPVSIGNPL